MDQYRTSSGFALPTVIITSVILFAVLVAVMSTVSSVRSTLNTQYNQALARDAAESGIAYAKYCYSVNAGTTNNTEWPKATTGDGATLDSGDDCTGKPQSGSNCDSTSPADVCFIVKNGNVKTRFSVNQPVTNGVSYSFSSTGNAGLYRPSTGQVSTWQSSNLQFRGYSQMTGLATGNDASCAIQTGRLYCWGRNDAGQVGVGSTTSVLTPTLIQGPLSGKNVYAVATGISHTCAIAGVPLEVDSTAVIYCWGGNTKYQYGIGNNTTTSTVPMVAASISGYYPVALSARDQTCVIAISKTSSTTRKMYCWGDNDTGQAGESGTATATPTTQNPKPIPGSPVRLRASPYSDLTNVTAISSVHATPSCGIDSDKAFCIGVGASGQLGDGLNASNPRVKYVITTSNVDLTGVGKIVTNNGYVCVISAGKIYCWGQNRVNSSSTQPDWRLDSGPNFAGALTTNRATLLITAGAHLNKTVTDIAISDWNTCFIISGAVYCAGYNNWGQLGQGYTSGPAAGAATSASQVLAANDALRVGGVLANKTATKIVGGNNHFCAATSDGGLYCWGWNVYGQLGVGNTDNQSSPVQAKLPPPTLF